MSPLPPPGRLFAPDDLSPERLADELATVGTVVRAAPEELRRQWLDTFDWRLWSAGARLVLETTGSGGALRWSPPGGEPEVMLPACLPPLCAADLPATLAGRRIAGLIGNRAATPVGCRVVRRTTLSLLDSRGKTVARVALERCLDPGNRGPGTRSEHGEVIVEGLLGYSREHHEVLAILTGRLGLVPAEDDGLTAAAAAVGRSPGDYRSRPQLLVRPDEAVEAAVRRYLSALLEVMVANLPGIRADLDVEFLHDLRVAVRRSRAAVGQLKDVVPADLRQRWGSELRWLGAATGPCRDLDVYLEEIGGLVREAGLAGPKVLEPFLELLRRQRDRAHRDLVSSLDHPRFSGFVEGWGAVLGEPFAAASDPPVVEVARRRIGRAHRRVLARGSEVGPGSAPEAFHRLRIDAKKLRYLLELFAGVLDEDRAEAAVRELKRIQDVLGELQDVAVQRERLVASARALLDASAAEAATLLAMGRLLAALDDRERSLRAGFDERFGVFRGTGGRTVFAELLGGEEDP